jgi:hypothetical protein
MHYVACPFAADPRVIRPMLGAAMLSFFDNLKYRSEVLVEVHAILNVVPELKSVLNTFPNLKNTISEFKKSTPPCDAAVYVSMVTIEKLIEQVPLQTRSLVFQQLTEQRDEGFLWFARVGQAIKKGEWSGYPAGMPLLTIVLGHAMWYLDSAEREGRLSAQTHKTFVADVGGMLLGKSPEERAAVCAQVAFNDIFGRGHPND